MATQVSKFADDHGKLFDTEVEADASNAKIKNQVEVETFVKAHFPAKANSKRSNPHASTAEKAIFLWIGSQGQQQRPYTVEA